jgi:hypothetical protein
VSQLTLKTEHEYYLNARDHWAQSRRDYWLKPNSRRLSPFNTNRYRDEVVRPFHAWLKEQGCQVKILNQDRDIYWGSDSYNVTLGRDVLEFDSQQELTAFVLRWAGTRVD